MIKVGQYDKLCVSFDYEDRISDISRLEAELALSELLITEIAKNG